MCDYKTKHKRNLLNHHKTIHERQDLQKFSCNHCGKGFSKLEYKKGHEKIHDENRVTYSCSFCKKRFSFKQGLKRHVKTDHEEAKIRCDLCSYETKRKDVLKSHVANVHKEDNK